jgi:hypothetical protein
MRAAHLLFRGPFFPRATTPIAGMTLGHFCSIVVPDMHLAATNAGRINGAISCALRAARSTTSWATISSGKQRRNAGIGVRVIRRSWASCCAKPSAEPGRSISLAASKGPGRAPLPCAGRQRYNSPSSQRNCLHGP